MDERATMSDTALDREIQAALDVDPSPEFLAGVRQRIEREPAPSLWRRRPRLVVIGGGLLLAAGLWSVPRRAEIAPPAMPPAPIVRNAPPVVVGPPMDPPAPQIAAAAPVRVIPVGTPEPPSSPDRFPPVILAENERAALRMLGAETWIEPPEPPEITVSTERAASARPELPPVSFDTPDMGPPVFETLSLE
jgi:hypothetical protein